MHYAKTLIHAVEQKVYCIGGLSIQTIVSASWWDYLQTLCKVSKGSLEVAKPEVSGSLSSGDFLHLQA
jgi:hypothetical protein